MNEAQRMQYLDAIGIDMYVPRWRLPNAPEPVQARLPERVDRAGAASGNDAALPVESAAPSTEALSSLNEGLHSVLADLQLDTPVTRTASDASTSVAKEEGQKTGELDQSIAPPHEPEAEFELNEWSLAGLEVFDSVHVGDALPTAALLRNILAQHGVLEGNLALPAHHRHPWPLPGRPQEKRWSRANIYFEDVLSGRDSHQRVSHTLLFGEAALHAIAGPDQDFEKQIYSPLTLSLDQRPLPALALPALRDLLYQPALKARAWEALVAYLSGLHDGAE